MNRTATVLLSILCGLVTGCQSTGVDQASSVAEKLRAVAVQLDQGKTAIDGAIGALNQFNAKGDLKAQMKAYVESLKTLDSKAAEILGLRTSLKAKQDEYAAAWQKNSATITNPDLRKKSEDRKNELVARLQGVGAKGDAARELYNGMRKDLGDIQTYLDHDLNQPGLDAVSGTAKSANKASVKLKESLDGITADLKKIADDIDVPAPPPPPTTTPAAK